MDPHFDALRRRRAASRSATRACGRRSGRSSATQGPEIRVEGRDQPVLNFCANNYLGLSGHPQLLAAAHRTLDEWGYGLSSVRFICGTQALHLELERRVARLPRAWRTRSSTRPASTPTAACSSRSSAPTTRSSPTLNHASIIDGVRLCKAKRLLYEHMDMADLDAKLREAAGARFRLIVTDGVFSMDGDIAPLAEICDLADRHRALVLVDDSHATGFMGRTGRGTPEHCGVAGRVDIITTTFGKALGGAMGGCIAGRQPMIDLLRQRSRPYLFSNSLAPVVDGRDAARAGAALREHRAARPPGGEHAAFRERMTAAGFEIRPGRAPDRADHVLPLHARRRAAGPALRARAARGGDLREGLLLPGGAARPVAHPRAALGRPHRRPHRARGGRLHQGRADARRCWA